MPAHAQNWRVDAKGILCYNQGHERLDDVKGMTLVDTSDGQGHTKSHQVFYGYRGWPAKVRSTEHGFIVTLADGGGVLWLLYATVYKDRRTKIPAHASMKHVGSLLTDQASRGRPTTPPPPCLPSPPESDEEGVSPAAIAAEA